MTVSEYYSYSDQKLTFTRADASAFAKEIAGDFNPIHDPDNRRFCVPGDLLFAVVLDLFAARETMNFHFENMVDDRVELLVQSSADGLQLTDQSGKNYLEVSHRGEKLADSSANAALIDAYAKFSGKTFPFLLVDLMQSHQVMINPQRPLVIYKSMSIELNNTDCAHFDLSFSESSLLVEGKKGEVVLQFDIVGDGAIVGRGRKNMLLGGLREYDQDVIDELVSEYNDIKTRYLSE